MSSPIKVLIVDPDYPRGSHLYGDVFVHTRLKAYPKEWEIKVIGYNPTLKESCEYTWDGISVYLSPVLDEIEQRIRDSQHDVIAIHFIQHELMQTLLERNKPLLIFFHGIESASWKRRLFDYTTPGAIPYLIRYIRSNRDQLRHLRNFLEAANQRKDIRFVFVSEWFQNICEKDIGIKILNKVVIPNSIDTNRFQYCTKPPEIRKRILAIRSFNSRKYANDILVDAIVALSRKPYFNELSFSIYGEGYMFAALTKKIRHFQNVHLHNHFVPNESIPAIHKEHGIFLCFSRLDSQGVSMCEAMSSGLVTITSRVAAIPEFVEDDRTGFLTQSKEDIIRCMDMLFHSPEVFSRISAEGSKYIQKKCSLPNVIPQEVNIIHQLVADRSMTSVED